MIAEWYETSRPTTLSILDEYRFLDHQRRFSSCPLGSPYQLLMKGWGKGPLLHWLWGDYGFTYLVAYQSVSTPSEKLDGARWLASNISLKFANPLAQRTLDAMSPGDKRKMKNYVIPELFILASSDVRKPLNEWHLPYCYEKFYADVRRRLEAWMLEEGSGKISRPCLDSEWNYSQQMNEDSSGGRILEEEEKWFRQTYGIEESGSHNFEEEFCRKLKLSGFVTDSNLDIDPRIKAKISSILKRSRGARKVYLQALCGLLHDNRHPILEARKVARQMAGISKEYEKETRKLLRRRYS